MEVSGGSGGFWLGFYLRKHSWVFNVEWCVGLYANVSGGGVLEGQISSSKDVLFCRAG